MGVLPAVLRLAASRVAAAVVVAALSGAPRLATQGARPAACCCSKQAARHECSCRGKRGVGDGAREAPPRAPPCHGAGREPARKSEPASGLALTCFRPGCGAPEAAVPRLSGVEAFTIPENRSVAPFLTAERMPELRGASSDVPGQPETPPPIAA